MNKTKLSLAALVAVSVLGAGCGGAPQTDKPVDENKPKDAAVDTSRPKPTPPEAIVDAKVEGPTSRASGELAKAPTDAKKPSDGSYTLPANSVMNWTGRKTMIKDYSDSGTVMVKEGKATVKGGVITEGAVTFDMSTLKTTKTSTGGDSSPGLDKHLKSGDFFDVEKNPTAELKLTSVTASEDKTATHTYTVKGDLTLKGVTKPVEFSAVIFQDKEGKSHIQAQFDLNRAHWDIKYGSGSFFKELGDKIIDDWFTVSIDLTAEKSK